MTLGIQQHAHVVAPPWRNRSRGVGRHRSGYALRQGSGAVAHLGERLPCKQEVAGSSPACSTVCGDQTRPERRFTHCRPGSQTWQSLLRQARQYLRSPSLVRGSGRPSWGHLSQARGDLLFFWSRVSMTAPLYLAASGFVPPWPYHSPARLNTVRVNHGT